MQDPAQPVSQPPVVPTTSVSVQPDPVGVIPPLPAASSPSEAQVQPADTTTAQPPVPGNASQLLGGHKEQEPIPSTSFDAGDVIEASEPQESVVLHPEVKEAGVEHVTQTVELPPEVAQAGITLMHEATPVQTQPTGIVQLKMSEEQVTTELKTHKNIRDSLSWLLIEMKKQYERMHRRMLQ